MAPFTRIVFLASVLCALGAHALPLALTLTPPPLGVSGEVSGQLAGDMPTLTLVNQGFAGLRIVLMISDDSFVWWDKTHTLEGVPVLATGLFAAAASLWVGAPQDLNARYFGAWAVPANFFTVPFVCEGNAIPGTCKKAGVTNASELLTRKFL